MKKKQITPILQVLLAAGLFGISAPLSKVLLGRMAPVPLAGFLYIGSGLGALVLLWTQRLRTQERAGEAPLARAEIPWLLGALLAGGVAAPVLMLASLAQTPASTASLLLNFESVGTTLIAALAFKESIGQRIGWAVAVITLSSLLLSLNGDNAWGFSMGALGILAACFLWGLDNNLVRQISSKNPLAIVTIKGLGAGMFSVLLAGLLGQPLPEVGIAVLAMLLGWVSYGLSIQFFILSMRELGAARSSALFGVAPFVGALCSIFLFQEAPPLLFWLATPIMLAGTWLMLTEKHGHTHNHERLEHSHRHSHADEHHAHADQAETLKAHAHLHEHLPDEHEHPHTPDLHHRH